jgi:hypothetical protein
MTEPHHPWSHFFLAHQPCPPPVIHVVWQDLFNSWSGYVESRLRKLIEYLSHLPVCRLRLLPKKLPLLSVADAQVPDLLI